MSRVVVGGTLDAVSVFTRACGERNPNVNILMLTINSVDIKSL